MGVLTPVSRETRIVATLDARVMDTMLRSSAKPENRGVVVTEAVSHLRLVDSRITQLKDHGPFGTCNERKEEEVAPVSPETRSVVSDMSTFDARVMDTMLSNEFEGLSCPIFFVVKPATMPGAKLHSHT